MKKLIYPFLLCLVLLPELIQAQSFYNFRRGRDIIATLGTGVSSYFGELSDPGDYLDTRPNLNLGLQYYFNNRVSARTEVTWFQLKGDDSESETNGRKTRNLSFISNNFEINAVGMIQAFENGLRYYQRPMINPYAFAGLGVAYFNPKGELNGKKHALQPLQTEGVKYGKTTLVIPFGAGARFKASPFFNISIEGGYRLTFTDYMDDVSTEYIDNSSFSDPIAAQLADRRPEIDLPLRPAGSQRGNPEANDGYFILNIKAEFYLPPQFLSMSKFKRQNVSRKRARRR